MTYLVAVFIGVLSSLIVAMFVEWMRKPRLRFSILPPEQVGLFGRGGALLESYVALKLRVSNDPLPIVFRWMQRQSARDCRATIHFLHIDGTGFISRKMPGRWAGSVQPVPLQGSIQPGNGHIEIHDIARLTAESRIHIPAGESEGLDVAVRFANSNVAFGWTNESYRHGGRHPDFNLPAGRYLVDILLHSEGLKAEVRFRIENDHNLNEFRLAML